MHEGEGAGKPRANSTVREEWELKGTDVIQLKIRVQGFSQTLEKKVSEQPGIEEEHILCGSREEGGRAPGNSGVNSTRHGTSGTLLGLDGAQPQTWSWTAA